MVSSSVVKQSFRVTLARSPTYVCEWYVNVLGPRVLEITAAESNGTAIITIQRYLVEGSELGSKLTFFAGSELSLASYWSSEDYFPATCEQELCPFNFLLWSCQVSSSELSLASYRLIEDYFPATYEPKLCPLNFLLASCQVSSSELQDAAEFKVRVLPEWGRFVTTVKLNIGLRDSNSDQLYAYLKQHEGRQNRGQGNNVRGVGAAGYGGAQNRVGYANPSQARQIKCYNCNDIAQENGVTLDEEQLVFIAGGQNNVVDDDVDEQPIQDLALNVDNAFQADDCDAFDSDVNEAPTSQTMFMANLSSADPVYDVAGLYYDSDVLSEVYDHDHYQDAIGEHHEVQEMHDDVQPTYVVDFHTGYTSDSNMILYDQYVKDKAVQVIQSDVSAVPNDAYMMILNDMHEPPTQHVNVTTHTMVVDKLLTVELATYKEQVKLYERRARFKLTEREQKIDEQLRIVITDCNIKEENLKKELHSIKMQLAFTINHNKSMVEEVTSLKKDFKQKENQYFEEFLDMKALKEKVKDKLFKQDQSL
nr:hypothetical protein [Tanacetum cinerariifolium]